MAANPTAPGGELQARPAQPAVVPDSGAPAQVPGPVPGPALPPAPAPAPTAGAGPVQAAHPTLAGQLAGPVFSLAAGKPGQYTMTLSVTPENLGPVTVRAHIGAELVRVELFAPNDAGREALRSILQDLKRDLAAAGLGTTLDLSARSGPDDGGQSGPRDRPGERAGNSTGRFQAVTAAARPDQDPHPHLRYAGTSGLDVLA
ncbi:flagellar hook-length control protein FliK [Pseudarthrobacter sp. NPDC092424]|uniref:flagellar hook-length control protein FliK n=1 Tax=Pseudarthrobacter sp. NPDC092424 TaxID=3364415 RepID=UPI003814EC6C